MTARDDEPKVHMSGGNGNGDGRREWPSLPPNPVDEETPDTWQDAFGRINSRSLELYDLNGQMLSELARVSALADGASRLAKSTDDKIDTLIGDVRGYRREVVEARQSIGHVRQAFDSQHDAVEEIARKAGREAAESTGVHEIKKILEANTFEQAKVIVADNAKIRSEWRTAAIGAFFSLVVAVTVIIVQAVLHAHP